MSSKKVGIISQVRMTSTRLPGKILLPAQDLPLLLYQVKRIAKAPYDFCIATTINTEDDVIAQFCEEHHVTYSRGSEDNVLERYYQAAKEQSYDVVVRITSDCPLIDGHLVHEGVQEYLKREDPLLYYSNCHQRTYPRGFDFEIFSFDLLEEAQKKAETRFQREHVTPYIWQDHPDVNMGHHSQPEDYSKFRITVDEPDDYQLVKTLIEDFGAGDLDHQGIQKILLENPKLYEINAHVEQKKV